MPQSPDRLATDRALIEVCREGKHLDNFLLNRTGDG